jgi:hypothetical protein
MPGDAFEVLRNLNVVGARPAPLTENLVEPVGVGALVSISYQLTAFDRAIPAILRRGRRHPPFDFGEVKGIEQLPPDFFEPCRRDSGGRNQSIHAGRRRDRRRQTLLRNCCSVHVHVLVSSI